MNSWSLLHDYMNEPPVPDKPWWTQNLEKLKNLLG
jgi:hypothetical protein